MNSSIATKIVAAYALFTWAGASFSHVTLQDPATAAGAGYRAALRVGHGCEGAPTKGLKAPAALLEVLDVRAAVGHSH